MSRAASSCSKKDVVVAVVGIAGKKLLLLSVEEADDVARFEDSGDVFIVFHEERELKRSRLMSIFTQFHTFQFVGSLLALTSIQSGKSLKTSGDA